ncbi:MAG: pitrilysin family protein [Chloroflexota bacterium]|nr:pitrilysin family protein [Chloroflexota bacterium]
MSAAGGSFPNSQNIVREVLPNGIVVLVYENFTAQSVVLTGSLAVGSAYESDADNGLASMVANALMRGSEHYDFAAMSDALESVGADLDLSSATFTTSFSGKALAEDLPLLLDILADVLRRPTFPTPEVERMRGETLTGLHYRQQDTRYRAGRAMYEVLYPVGHPYHLTARGTLESVPRLTIDQMRAFHQAHYGPREMMMVIVGAVRAADAIEAVRARLGDWVNPAQPSRPSVTDAPRPTEERRIHVTIPGKTQSDIVMGTLGPSRLHADWHAAQLANSVLGQFGMMGRIGGKVREELGLAYYAYSQVEGGMTALPWTIAAGVDPQNVDLAVARSLDEVRRLIDEPISDDDLSDNQSFFSGRLPLQLETNEGIASMIRNIETFDLGLDYLLGYRDTIYRLTRADVQRAARLYLDPANMVIAVAGPAAV